MNYSPRFDSLALFELIAVNIYSVVYTLYIHINEEKKKKKKSKSVIQTTNQPHNYKTEILF